MIGCRGHRSCHDRRSHSTHVSKSLNPAQSFLQQLFLRPPRLKVSKPLVVQPFCATSARALIALPPDCLCKHLHLQHSTTSSCPASLSSRPPRVRTPRQQPTSSTANSSQASALPFPPASSPRSSSPTSVHSSHGSTSPSSWAAWLSVFSTSATRWERLAPACSPSLP